MWARDSATLLYLQDDGDELWRLYAVSAEGGEPRALTPAGAVAEIVGLSAADPEGVVVMVTAQGEAWPEVVRIDVATGTSTLLQRRRAGFARYVLDRDNKVRLALRPQATGGFEILARAPAGTWSPLFAVPFEDAQSSRPIAFEAGGATFLMLDSTGRDRTALVRVDVATGAKAVLGESARADVVDAWLDPATNAPEAFATEYLRREWRALDPDAQGDLAFLGNQLEGEFSVVSRSADDSRWIVVEAAPTTPPRTYLYDRTVRDGRRISLLFRHRPNLEQASLSPMTPVEIEARDGLTLVSYLTLPPGADADGDGRPEAPVPLVLAVHDAPWSRDSYGFDALHQWLANRGYAALSVNFRGSSGFGKAFLNAGNGQWGGRIQEDLVDAVQWLVDNGVAQRDRIAVMGAGYGGYAALASLAFQSSYFRCAVSYSGPAALQSYVESAPLQQRDEIYLRTGDARTAEGRQLLRERSPLIRAEQVRQPLLLALGARDPRISRAESDQFSQAMRARRAPITYLVFPEEGRELTHASNRLAYFAVAEHFLSACLGGRAEPVGASFEGARLQVFENGANVPGLSGFVQRPAVRPAVASPEVPPALDRGAEPAVAPAEQGLIESTLAPREP